MLKECEFARDRGKLGVGSIREVIMPRYILNNNIVLEKNSCILYVHDRVRQRNNRKSYKKMQTTEVVTMH